jgi:hypothetical protein
MRFLEEITGQRVVIAQALERQKLPRKECLLVYGPEGSGVSWTLSQIGMEWERCGGTALRAAGADTVSTYG